MIHRWGYTPESLRDLLAEAGLADVRQEPAQFKLREPRDMPPWSVGFVYVPAAIGIATMSVITARYGARLAHRLTGNTLRRVFALVLVALATKMVLSV